MDQLKAQVARAHRRLVMQQFLGIATWSLFASLLVGLLGVAVVKIWPLPVDGMVWTASWAGGAVGVGLLTAVVTTYLSRRRALDAAIEIDRRFGLRERVSSTLAMSETELASEVGQALVSDAARRVERIDVGEQFGLQFSWRNLLPLAPALLVFLLAMFVPDATQRQQAQAAAANAETTQQIKKATAKLRQKLDKKRKELEEKGLKDASELIAKLETGVDELTKQDKLDKKQAMIKLNELSKELAKRRDKLGGADEVRKQFERLKDLEKGPADDLVDAMQKGDFDKAMKAAEDLRKQVAQGDLSKEEQQQLAKQLEQMKQKLDELKAKREQAKQDLERQIQQKRAAGDNEAVNKLQQQLEKLQQMDQQMQKLDQMAAKMGECAKCLNNGDSTKASQNLQELAGDLAEMQDELTQMAALEEALDQLADAKSGMNQAGMGQGMGQNPNGMPGMGLGEGQGMGERPEEETDTGSYDSQVRGKVEKGPAVKIGEAEGGNHKGQTLEDVKAAIRAEAGARDSDPINNQPLSRDQKDHTRDYFKRFGNAASE